MIRIVWTDSNESWVDLIPDSVFSHTPPKRLRHFAYSRGSGSGWVDCQVRTGPGLVELDYGGALKALNEAEWDLGVTRIKHGSGFIWPVDWKWDEENHFLADQGYAEPFTAAAQVRDDLSDLNNRKSRLGKTTFRQLIDAQLGQGGFRAALMSRWGGQCALTVHRQGELLRASHIKPWFVSSDDERLSGSNGLLLAAHVDALFDRWLITFEDDGELRWSDRVPEDERAALGLPDRLREPLTEPERGFLKHHRAVFAQAESGAR